ncbi:hypothetical protein B0I37DRAFT_241620 [Chaetomium sp. MPI-CAGE-AT-0009]|nr:hypothetical protein B0I37DRAFT_241620 [Chaetomium sp. MPI-CAGE-AT-0009]
MYLSGLVDVESAAGRGTAGAVASGSGSQHEEQEALEMEVGEYDPEILEMITDNPMSLSDLLEGFDAQYLEQDPQHGPKSTSAEQGTKQEVAETVALWNGDQGLDGMGGHESDSAKTLVGSTPAEGVDPESREQDELFKHMGNWLGNRPGTFLVIPEDRAYLFQAPGKWVEDHLHELRHGVEGHIDGHSNPDNGSRDQLPGDLKNEMESHANDLDNEYEGLDRLFGDLEIQHMDPVNEVEGYTNGLVDLGCPNEGPEDGVGGQDEHTELGDGFEDLDNWIEALNHLSLGLVNGHAEHDSLGSRSGTVGPASGQEVMEAVASGQGSPGLGPDGDMEHQESVVSGTLIATPTSVDSGMEYPGQDSPTSQPGMVGQSVMEGVAFAQGSWDDIGGSSHS